MATLKNICTFFQNLNEYVYASDIETNELVYLNHKAMDAFGVKNTDEIRGPKVLRGVTGLLHPMWDVYELPALHRFLRGVAPL